MRSFAKNCLNELKAACGMTDGIGNDNDPDALANSVNSIGLKVTTGQSSFEEFLNEYKFANIENKTGKIQKLVLQYLAP